MDYHTVRDELIRYTNRIVAAVATNPDFVEHFGPRVAVSGHIMPQYFPPEVELPADARKDADCADESVLYEPGVEYSDPLTMAQIADALGVKAKRAGSKNRDVRKRLPGRVIREGRTYKYRVKLDGLPEVLFFALKRS